MTVRQAPLVLLALVASLLTGCGDPAERVMPRCEAGSRLAIIAQSVPDAAYVPCVADLPTGWSFEGLDVHDGGATISLESDRADRTVHVELVPSCDVAEATPITPSDAGVRTYHTVVSIDPRFAGRFSDVFPGGCVVTSYDFARGPHVALVTELRSITELFPRRELRRALADDLGITLDP